MIWAKHFVDAQGYHCLPDLNGKDLSSQQTCNLNICYLFIRDQVDQGWLDIDSCPTGNIQADFFTKQLQGWQFCKHHTMIKNAMLTCMKRLGYSHETNYFASLIWTGICWALSCSDQEAQLCFRHVTLQDGNCTTDTSVGSSDPLL